LEKDLRNLKEEIKLSKENIEKEKSVDIKKRGKSAIGPTRNG